MSKSVRVSLLQYSPVWEDREASRKKIRRLLEGLGTTDWLVLPEMALSGFSMNSEATEWKTEDYGFFAQLANEQGCAITVGGVQDRKNTAFVFDAQGELISKYAKRHLFSFSGEDRNYEPGFQTATYEVGAMRVGQAICYDLRFPYHFWSDAPRLAAYCVIAAWGGKRSEHWKTLLKARAIENQAFVIGVNRIGEEPGVQYSGDSSVIDPLGNVLLDCGSREGTFTIEIDPGAVEVWRKGFTALKDRRE